MVTTTGAADRDLLDCVRAARRALIMGETETAYSLVAAMEHRLAYGLDSLSLMDLDQFVESAKALPVTGVQTAEKALARVVVASRSPEPGPTAFTLIVSGEIEGSSTADLFSSSTNDSERDRVMAWLAGNPELATVIGALLHRFPG
jgi:hypothetical protein